MAQFDPFPTFGPVYEIGTSGTPEIFKSSIPYTRRKSIAKTEPSFPSARPLTTLGVL
jgi:hypothetical protein